MNASGVHYLRYGGEFEVSPGEFSPNEKQKFADFCDWVKEHQWSKEALNHFMKFLDGEQKVMFQLYTKLLSANFFSEYMKIYFTISIFFILS